jgi:hypothetical protein
MVRILLAFTTITMNLFILGCSRAFQPPPPVYEEWTKKNASVQDVKLSMISCGYPNVLGAASEPDNNKIALMHLCMEGKGFKFNGKTFCQDYKNLPACVAAAEEKAAQKHNGNPSIR